MTEYKCVKISQEVWEKLNDYKHDNRLNSMEAALKKLLGTQE